MGAAVALSAWGLRASYVYLMGAAASAAAVYVTGSWLIVFNGPERKLLLNAITNRSQTHARDEVMADIPCQ